MDTNTNDGTTTTTTNTSHTNTSRDAQATRTNTHGTKSFTTLKNASSLDTIGGASSPSDTSYRTLQVLHRITFVTIGKSND